MFATKRNTGKFATATRAKVAVAGFPRLSLVFLRDWCVSAKLVTDWDTNWLPNFDGSGIGVRVLSEPMKVKAPKSVTHFPAVRACYGRLSFAGFVLSPYRGSGEALQDRVRFLGTNFKSLSRRSK